MGFYVLANGPEAESVFWSLGSNRTLDFLVKTPNKQNSKPKTFPRTNEKNEEKPVIRYLIWLKADFVFSVFVNTHLSQGIRLPPFDPINSNMWDSQSNIFIIIFND
jgi:hypothetical protein